MMKNAFGWIGFLLVGSLASTVILRCVLCDIKIINKELTKLSKDDEKK